MAAFKLVILSLLIAQNAAIPQTTGGGGGFDQSSTASGVTSQGRGPPDTVKDNEPAHDASQDHSRAGHQYDEASKSDEETNGKAGEAEGVEAGPVVEAGDPWSSEDVGALFITLLVLFILLGLGVSFGAYMCWKKKDSKMQEEAGAEKEKMPAVAIGSKEPADIGDDVSTQAGSAPVSQVPSRRSSKDQGAEAPADMQAADARV